MLDRESACNRVFLARRFVLFGADGVGLRFKPVFNLAAAQRSTMSSPLPYCRTNQTSSDVGMIDMITASARHRWTYRRRNGTKRKFFNDFSRARACAYAQGGVRSDSARRQIFAGTHLSIWLSCRYFPINVVWLDQPQLRHHQHFPLHPDRDLPDNAHSSES